ncbi:glyoxalase-like domain-containing protein [Kalaharituber pfeilii]|nr:glyoxalase-like domain-containing protein [Kalaharituber pfeilii]
MEPSCAQIDHIVILLTYAELRSPPSWLTSNFTLTPGGVHADGRTENKLILFQDGSYIELIAFINDDPTLKEGHRWGKKQPGLIDFALTSPTDPGGGDSAAVNYEALKRRISTARSPGASLGIEFLEPVEGGRKRQDGTEVKWKVTIPTLAGHGAKGAYASMIAGSVPFWCHDVTSRSLRVDSADKEATTHPSGVKGIAQFSVIVPPQKLESYIDLYSLILNTKPVRVFGTARLELEAPIKTLGLVKPWVFIETPGFDIERHRLVTRGVEIVEIALRIGAQGGGVGVARDSVQEEGIWIHFLK